MVKKVKNQKKVVKINTSKKNNSLNRSRFYMLTLLGLLIIIIFSAFFYFNTSDISNIKSQDKVGENVRIRGEVTATIKLGELSGYTIQDETGSIAVSSLNIPKKGSIKTVTGTLMKDSLFGYYIKE